MIIVLAGANRNKDSVTVQYDVDVVATWHQFVSFVVAISDAWCLEPAEFIEGALQTDGDNTPSF